MDTVKTGAMIAEERKKKGMTQEELGNRLGVTNTAVSKWERGICFPDIALLSDLSEILGLTVNELINGERTAETCAEIDEAVEKTLEISRAEIKRKKGKTKKVIIAAFAVLLAVITAFAICLGIAFTPADGFGKTDTLRVKAYPSGTVYEFGLKCRVNVGDYYAYGAATFKDSGKWKKVAEKITAEAKQKYNAEVRDVYVGIRNVIKIPTESGADFLLLDLDGSGNGDISPMYIRSLGVAFPIYLLSGIYGRYGYYSTEAEFGAELLLADIYRDREKVDGEIKDFYLQSGYFEVQNDGEGIRVRLKENASFDGELNDGMTKAFSGRTVAHGEHWYCIISE